MNKVELKEAIVKLVWMQLEGMADAELKNIYGHLLKNNDFLKIVKRSKNNFEFFAETVRLKITDDIYKTMCKFFPDRSVKAATFVDAELWNMPVPLLYKLAEALHIKTKNKTVRELRHELVKRNRAKKIQVDDEVEKLEANEWQENLSLTKDKEV